MNRFGILLAALPLLAVSLAAQPFVPGQSTFGRNNYIEYIAGNSPFILSAPHGGSLEPAEIPDRTFGTTTKDANTEETAREIQAAYHALTGAYPHVIICRLHRRKIDANREVVEGAQGNEFAVQAWNEFHAFIDSAKAAAVRSHGAAFYIDLHGHGHTVQRLELGYLLSASQLDLPDNTLNSTPGYRNISSIRTMAAAAGVPFAEVLRGESSFGGFMEYLGYPSVPGVLQPTPGNDPYFNGGYNTERHGSQNGGTVSGLQIESNYTGVRDTDANRKAYARAIADAVARFSRLHLFHDVTLLRPAVRINEVLFDVPADDAGTPALEGDINGDGVRSARGDEFIEIVNAGSDTASIGGYRLADRDMTSFFTFPEGTRLAPNGVAVVFGGMGPGGSGPAVPAGTLVFAARPGAADSGFTVSASKTNLLSAGDGVVLLDPSVNYAADEVCWGSAAVRTKNGRKLIAPNTASGDSIAGAIQQSVTRTVPGTGAWTKHRSVSSSACSPGAAAVMSVGAASGTVPVTPLLVRNYPNPFNPSTEIRFQLASAGRVTVTVFDLLGRRVATLLDEHRPAGTGAVRFSGEGRPSGVYLCSVSSGGRTVTVPMTLLK